MLVVHLTASTGCAQPTEAELGEEAPVSSTEVRSPREPKYYTVKRHLLEIIDALQPGRPVPTERVLAVELGTSRTTVRQALFELVTEGRLVRRQGSGTFVAEPKLTWPLQLASFTEQATANGLTTSNQLLSADRRSADEHRRNQGKEARRIAIAVAHQDG